jgi:hypothetical protein
VIAHTSLRGVTKDSRSGTGQVGDHPQGPVEIDHRLTHRSVSGVERRSLTCLALVDCLVDVQGFTRVPPREKAQAPHSWRLAISTDLLHWIRIAAKVERMPFELGVNLYQGAWSAPQSVTYA